MNNKLKTQAGLLFKGLNNLKGKRRLRVIGVNANPEEMYHFHVDNGGRITIYCTETIYEVVYDAWWARNEKHYSYKVYGVCDSLIPEEFANRISQGFHIGRLLAKWARPSDQKKAAIHAYVSMIVDEFARQ